MKRGCGKEFSIYVDSNGVGGKEEFKCGDGILCSACSPDLSACKDETLSDKWGQLDEEQCTENKYYEDVYVKKFIIELREDLDTDWANGDIGMNQYHRRRESIDKRAGEELINDIDRITNERLIKETQESTEYGRNTSTSSETLIKKSKKLGNMESCSNANKGGEE